MEGRTGHIAMLFRSEDHQKAAGVEIGAGETPLGQFIGIVSQIPATQVHGLGAGIINLDPVFVGTVLVGQCACVVRHKFRDNDRAGGVRRGAQRQYTEQEGGRKRSHE